METTIPCKHCGKRIRQNRMETRAYCNDKCTRDHVRDIRRVYYYKGQGLSVEEIAAKLDLTTYKVQSHIRDGSGENNRVNSNPIYFNWQRHLQNEENSVVSSRYRLKEKDRCPQAYTPEEDFFDETEYLKLVKLL